MLTKKEEGIVLIALLALANSYFEEWENGKGDFYREGILSILDVARKIDSGSQYTHDIGALVTKLNQ